ncbi:hypothetical protein BX611_3024 [Lutibacter oceani]|uniref:Uncharacterized protein n=1 Tax=Lutibacter oceani TaxID=1853311 RepID=A0A3D9RRW4_9FLAO|nr:hypothetical protein [Lutibacter oceani]REE78714.1 hypothetical protein BX611_3024 [Lutibacter oceani]
MKNILQLSYKPLIVIREYKLIFFTWFLFTVLAGQIGVFSNFIIRVINGDLTFSQSLFLDSVNGSFYTYSIALLASVLGPLFVNLIENHPTKFKSIKIITIIISIFTLYFAGVFYSSSSVKSNFESLKELSYGIDWWQFFFLVISIFIAIYSFSVIRLENNYDKYKIFDDNYSNLDDEKVDSLNDKSEDIKTDSKGNKI